MVRTWRGETGFIPSSENRHPLLLGSDVSLSDVRAFLIRYDHYDVERQRTKTFDGEEGRVASIRELLRSSVVQLPDEDHSRQEKFIDDAIREALEMFANQDHQQCGQDGNWTIA